MADWHKAMQDGNLYTENASLPAFSVYTMVTMTPHIHVTIHKDASPVHHNAPVLWCGVTQLCASVDAHGMAG